MRAGAALQNTGWARPRLGAPEAPPRPAARGPQGSPQASGRGKGVSPGQQLAGPRGVGFVARDPNDAQLAARSRNTSTRRPRACTPSVCVAAGVAAADSHAICQVALPRVSSKVFFAPSFGQPGVLVVVGLWWRLRSLALPCLFPPLGESGASRVGPPEAPQGRGGGGAPARRRGPAEAQRRRPLRLVSRAVDGRVAAPRAAGGACAAALL
jgi:hypothetical protein